MRFYFNNNIDLNQQAQIIQWEKDHLPTLKKYLTPIENSKWGRLLCHWCEKKENGDILHHRYAAIVNTENYEIYLDCRPRKIFAKCLSYLCVRLIHTFFKTLYHLSLVGVANEIFKVYEGRQTKTEALKNSIKSIADIVRTPLYGVAMTVTALAGLLIGLLAPRTLYTTREFLGKLEESLYWGEKKTFFTMAPCFQPLSLIDLTSTYQYPSRDEDTIYSSNNPLEVSLAHYARRAIRLRRKKHNIFDQLSGTLDGKLPYTSRSIEHCVGPSKSYNWLIPQKYESFSIA